MGRKEYQRLLANATELQQPLDSSPMHVLEDELDTNELKEKPLPHEPKKIQTTLSFSSDLLSLSAKLRCIEHAEREEWKAIDERQQALAVNVARLSGKQFVGIRQKIARFRYLCSAERAYYREIHRREMREKYKDMFQRKREMVDMLDRAREELKELKKKGVQDMW